MKKALILLALIMTIATSVVAGTLAVYNVDLGKIAEGSVVAKEFVLVGEGIDSFSDTVKIAPTEKVTKKFKVSNFEGNMITETAMEISVDVSVQAADGKTAIPYLTANIKNEKGNVIGTGGLTDGHGTITFTDEFAKSDVGQTYTYEIEIEWPSSGKADSDKDGLSDDAEFAGHEFGNKLIVSVRGTQK